MDGSQHAKIFIASLAWCTMTKLSENKEKKSFS